MGRAAWLPRVLSCSVPQFPHSEDGGVVVGSQDQGQGATEGLFSNLKSNLALPLRPGLAAAMNELSGSRRHAQRPVVPSHNPMVPCHHPMVSSHPDGHDHRHWAGQRRAELLAAPTSIACLSVPGDVDTVWGQGHSW